MRIFQAGEISLGTQVFDDSGRLIDLPISAIHIDMSVGEKVRITLELETWHLDFLTNKQSIAASREENKC